MKVISTFKSIMFQLNNEWGALFYVYLLLLSFSGLYLQRSPYAPSFAWDQEFSILLHCVLLHLPGSVTHM